MDEEQRGPEKSILLGAVPLSVFGRALLNLDNLSSGL